MKLQVARNHSKFKGQAFWGCSGFPDCKAILSIEKGAALMAGEFLESLVKKFPALRQVLKKKELDSKPANFSTLVKERKKNSSW